MKIFTASLILLVLCLSGCKETSFEIPEYTGMDELSFDIVPRPESLDTTHMAIDLGRISFFTDSGSFDRQELEQITKYLDKMSNWRVLPASEGVAGMRFRQIEEPSLGAEGYLLSINRTGVEISAQTEEGVARAIQSLAQIRLQGVDTVAMALRVKDRPAYDYRGMMLDVARHFFTVEEVKTLLDQLALYKINFLHLHLADDQGWRIEIKSWPDLTRIGGSSEVGGGPGGFYTQDEFREIVAYAASRYITVVPEIDMPGHTNAALASYPELNCDGKARELYKGTRVGFSTLCVRNELTYEFVGDVIRELADLTEGPYIHIGGDESHVTAKEDYRYFINRVYQIVQKYDKKMIGWDEIADADIGANAVVQYWRGKENAVQGASKGADVLFSLADKLYLDMKYDEDSRYGLDWAGHTTIEESYDWSLRDATYEDIESAVIGIEAPLWSETVKDLNEAEYLIYPRLLSAAEIGWTADSLRSWEDFRLRLDTHLKILEKLAIDYYPYEEKRDIYQEK